MRGVTSFTTLMLDEVVGNIISADHDPTATEILMSNGLTSVFLDGAIARQRWNVLDYEPNTDRLLPCLSEFRGLIERFPVSACPPEAFTAPWSTAGLRSDRAMCPRHGVYLHNLNEDDTRCCQLCNR